MTQIKNIHPQVKLREAIVIKTSLLIFITLFISTFSKAQDIVEGEIIGGQSMEILVGTHFGDNSKIIDTIIPNNAGYFKYHFDQTSEKGLYRFYFNNTLWLDFILGYENIKFQTVAAAPKQSLIIFEGDQNEALHDFYRIVEEKENAKIILQNFVMEYPEADKAMKSAKKTLKSIVKTEQKFLSNLKKSQANAFVTNYLNFLYKQTWENLVSKKQEDKILEYSSRDWNNSRLLNSDAYAKGIINFLILFTKQNAGKEQQAALFRKAVDSLFSFIPPGSKVYDYTTLYLMQGFEQYEMESVIMHIVENYSSKCSQTEEALSNRIEFYKHFYNGAEIPNFTLSQQNGETIQFYELAEKTTLLVFWSTDCPHCNQMNMAIKEMYPEFYSRGVKVISVSLDEDMRVLSRYLKQASLPWTVYADGAGWDSQMVEDFHLYATPTMFLVNENYQLIGKPMNLNQLFFLLNQIQ